MMQNNNVDKQSNYLIRLPKNPQVARPTVYAWKTLGLAYCYSRDYAEAAKCYQRSLKLALKMLDREAVCDTLLQIGANEYLWGKTLVRDLLGQEQTQGQKRLSKACGYQLRAWQVLTQALEIARESDWRFAVANGIELLAKVYREIDYLQNASWQPSRRLKTPSALGKLQNEAMLFQISLEVEYEREFIIPKPFNQMGFLEKASRLFELSGLIADEVNNFHLALQSYVELSRILIDLDMEDQARMVIRRIERGKGYDYREKLYAAMNEITMGDLDFKHQRFDAALQKYKRAYADISDQSGYNKNWFTDRLKDLELHIRSLEREMALQWCDALESEWLKRPELLRLPENIRLDVLGQKAQNKDQ